MIREKQVCPVCGGDTNASIAALWDVWKRHPVKDAYLNAGGAELHFEDGRRLQVSNCCNQCDMDKIRAFLGEDDNAGS